MDMTSTGKAPTNVRNYDRGVGLRTRLDRIIDRALEGRRIVGTVVLVAKATVDVRNAVYGS